ncbi:MAG: glycoside hydrolase family 9 protein, partial [Verrucomicrobiota bacterium]
TNTPPSTGGDTTTTNTPPPVVDTNTPSTTVTNPPAASMSTNALLPGTSIVDNLALQMPKPGDYGLHILSPTLLELKRITTKDPDPAQVTTWNLVNSSLQFMAPPANAFAVMANGQNIAVQSVGFKRRPLYAPLVKYDLRIENSLYLQLSAPISDNQTIEVKNPDGSLWSTSMQYTAKADPLRYSPAIHVNQEGYMPGYSKKAMVGYYIGSMGEMNVLSSSGFKIVDANSGSTVYTGSLIQRADVGYLYTPTPYQKVYEADFTSFNTPGLYKLVVPGMGASLPFSITDGIAMNFARAYALGLYHQRCGMDNSLPYTRHTHDACHTAPAAVPTSATAFPFTWSKIAEYANITNPDNPSSTAPKLTSPSAQLFPFQRTGNIDVSGGHHDAGDYSKYTLNSVALIHYLTFAADSMPGVAALDNMGIPESGDGISDILQEAKWEADFLAKMQDTDGGFYFLVYPQNREYEGNVMPDKGDPQLVWPKTSTATASSVAALAEIGSSPAFKRAYPDVAKMYLQKAQLGWQFLMNAISKYGKNGIYQKITHYGDDFADQDELAWAAAAMFVATGDAQYQNTLFQWFPDPTNPATFRWGWWRLFLSYGNAVRDYAFAVRSGRLQASQINSAYLAKCESVITAAGDDMVLWSKQNAYGTSFPEATKHVQGAGWYFSGEQTFDLTTAYQITPKADYMMAILANMNFEGGCNPVNVSYVTGMGWKRERDAVSQYGANDRRIMPPTGEPIGNIQYGFSYLDLYKGSLGALTFPSDGATVAPHPYYDRWADSWNVSTEFVTFLQARSLATYAFVAAQTGLKTQPWKAVQGQINIPSGTLVGPITFTLQAPGVDLSSARIAWETRDGEPAMGSSFTFTPKNSGSQWIEAEAQLPDGRRIFAATNFTATTANIIWVDDNLPAGAKDGTDGGDSWTWVTSNPSPTSGSMAHQSALVSGTHQHFFKDATATMNVETGTVLYAYIYLDPATPPSEAMLQWYDGSSWEHRTYWGANNIAYGTDGTVSRKQVGPMPAAGQWVQLKVPASQVGLEGKTVTGMGFTLNGGRATWDAAGLLNPSVTNTTSGSNTNSGSTTNTPTGGGTGSTNTNTTLPTVSITAKDGSVVGNSPGVFTFTRTGSTTSSLSVAYSLSGNATDTVQPQTAPAVEGIIAVPSVTIPAGATSATLTIAPSASTNIVDAKTAMATIATNANYNVAAPGNATVTIAGNIVSKPAFQMTPAGPTLSWASTNGSAYRIAYKNSLTDPAWSYMTNTLSATNNLSSWTDTNNLPQRFYMIMQVQ